MIEFYPEEMTALIAHLKKLPGVGARTAERFAFHMLDWKQEELEALSELTKTLKDAIAYCEECFCIMQETTCHFCSKTHRDRSSLCIVGSAKEVFAIEKTHTYKGLYHVLGGLLSPLEGITEQNLHIDALKRRIQKESITEIIIALDSTIEGDATSLFLKKELASFPLRISRLAYGIPMGSPLEFVDGTTLSRALMGRQQV